MLQKLCTKHLSLNSFSSLNNRCGFSTALIAKDLLFDTSPTQEHLRDILLNICLKECRKIHSPHMFDQMPERVEVSLNTGKIIHALSLKIGFSSGTKLGNAILDLYAKCGQADYTEKFFSLLQRRDELSWNSIMMMKSRKGLFRDVLLHFRCMKSYGVMGNQFSFAVVLSASAKIMDVLIGKQVHCAVLKMGFHSDAYCEGALIDMYAKCDHLVLAKRIFDESVEPDTISWTALVSGFAEVGLIEEAIEVFQEMQKTGRVPDQVMFVTILNACVGGGKLEYACHLFSLMPNPNVVAWNIMLSGHTKSGNEEEAIRIFKKMVTAGVQPTRSTLGSIMSAIAASGNHEVGFQVHACAVKRGLDSNVYAGSSLIKMYAKCQRMASAKAVFDGLAEKNVVLWNALLGGYALNGYAREVLESFKSLKVSGCRPDEYTYTSMLTACACLKNMDMGRGLHSYIIKNEFGSNLYVGNALVDMYSKCGNLPIARKLFEQMKNRDHISWNAIIVGYVQDENEVEAFSMFHRMISYGISSDEVSLASVMSASASLQDLKKGMQFHCFLVKYGLDTSLYAGSSLIDMYCKCGRVEAAVEVFSRMPERSVVCLNALISGLAQLGLDEAVKTLKYMLAEGLKPSEVTFATILQECSDLYLGSQIHGLIVKLGLSFRDEFLVVSLLGMYMSAQSNTDASSLFCEIPHPKSTIIWTVLISGSTQNEYDEEAIHWYQEMRRHDVMPDQATFASVLKACSSLSSLEQGTKIHSVVFHTGYDKDELIGSALVDMYAKSGDVKSSARVFVEMLTKKDVISWNSMIVGYAKNGFGKNALDLFDEMKKTKVKPDEVTFLGVLTACSHTGMISKGREIFEDMISQYGIHPRVDHCACMIDLFGRWGFLREANSFIENLDFEPGPMIWATYLNACRLHKDDIRGQHAAEKLVQLDPENSSSYVLLSNIHASSGNWDSVNFVRREMNERGVKKFPGCSWIVIGQKTSFFVAGDNHHPDAGEIFLLLKELAAVMKDEQCVSET